MTTMEPPERKPCDCATRRPLEEYPKGWGLVVVDIIEYPYPDHVHLYDKFGVWFHGRSNTYYYARTAGRLGETYRPPFADVHVHLNKDGSIDSTGSGGQPTLFYLGPENFDAFATDVLKWWVDARDNMLVLTNNRGEQERNKKIADILSGLHEIIVESKPTSGSMAQIKEGSGEGQ